MASVTIISPDMVAHLGGCADIKRRRTNRHVNPGDVASAQTYKGETLLDAILAADEDLASWFGEKPYQDDMTHWTVATCEVEPCLVKAMRAEGVAFGDRGRPERKATHRRPTVQTPERPVNVEHQCLCGCGGFPKGKKSRYLPGHDAKHNAARKVWQVLGVPGVD